MEPAEVVGASSIHFHRTVPWSSSHTGPRGSTPRGLPWTPYRGNFREGLFETWFESASEDTSSAKHPIGLEYVEDVFQPGVFAVGLQVGGRVGT